MNALRLSAASPSAVSVIKDDHAAALALFRKLRPDSSEMFRQAVLRRLCSALEVHAQVEDELFYPALRDSSLVSPLLDKSAADHEETRRAIQRLREAGHGEPQREALNALMNGVMHHMADEETRLLLQAESALGVERLRELGAQMTGLKLELDRPHAGRRALDTIRAAPAQSGVIAAAAALGVMAWWMLTRQHHERRPAH